jgi:low temperature requirement protein LtrA
MHTMSTKPADAGTLHHHVRPMCGRDPHEDNRVATPLELLFDLTFATSFGLAAAQFAHALAGGAFGAALFGFGFASFAICWAWINFSWFASAYDTDDWLYRVITLVQMTGVLVLAIGLPRLFESIGHDDYIDDAVMVLGYVIMRAAMLCQWLRAARQDPEHRRACLTYATVISIVQVGWVVQIAGHFPPPMTIGIGVVLLLAELAGPVLSERICGGTPWHAHHIVDRYSCFAIIALGEGIVGTIAAMSAVVGKQGWSRDAALICVAGTGLIFGMWWVYYMLPSAKILHERRDRSFVWGYGQLLIFTAIVATGAGLHVAAYFIEHESHLGALATLLSVAIPVGIFLGGIYALYYYLVRQFDRLHVWLVLTTAAVVVLAVASAAAGINMAICLVVLMFAPVVTVVGYEAAGYRHQAHALARQQVEVR